MAVNWLDNCTRCHDKCHVPNEQGFRPKRLIDLNKRPGFFCVISTDEEETPETVRYATLSYRWETQPQILLTTYNKDELAAGRPVTDLSQTFQDGILVARRMDVHFLWVDCLCIIQDGDDGKDWLSESLCMKDIYGNSYCSLSLDYTLESGGSIFFDRDPTYYARVHIQTWNDVEDGDVIDWTSVDTGMWQMEVNNSPLRHRGWAFQERLLAPRVLHFCRQELFWECRQEFHCESFPDALPSGPLTLDLRYSKSFPDLPSESLWEGFRWDGRVTIPSTDLGYELWDNVVKAYTKCIFTYPQDKLVAISGVAQYAVQHLLIQDTYLAGIWRKRLAAELAWWLYPDRDRFVLGKEDDPILHYYAPSFSWASVKGQINSLGPFISCILVEVECVSIESGPYDDDNDDDIFTSHVFGPLRSPPFQLRLEGRLRSCRLFMDKQNSWKLQSTMVTMSGENDYVELLPWLDFEIPIAAREEMEAETFYIMDWRWGPDSGTAMALDFMVLRLMDRARHQYRRIGWCYLTDTAIAENMLGDTTRATLPGYFKKDKGTHVIYVI